MKFERPFVPSRGFERICFGAVALAVVAIALFSLWSAWRDLIDWQTAPILVLIMSIGSLPVLILGYFLRRYRLKKAAEMREYERVLASLLEDT